MTTSTQKSRISSFSKAMLALQVFLLRRNWFGSMADQIMVITTTGRVSGKSYSLPIGFLNDDQTILALTNAANPSNWYKNLLKNQNAVLEIKGNKYLAIAEPVMDPDEVRKIFNRYRTEKQDLFPRYFGIPASSSADELDKAMISKRYVRFYPQTNTIKE